MTDMPRKPIRLIVTDLDGTLLNSAHEVSPRTEAAIHAAQAQGVAFTVATGKTFPSTTALIERFDIQLPVICGNGTSVHDIDGTVLYEDPIPPDLAVEAVHFAAEHGMTPVIYVAGGLLVPVWDENVDVLVEHHEPPPEVLPDLAPALRDGYHPHKIILMNQDLAKVSAFQKLLEARFAGRGQVIRSGLPEVVELLPQGVSKATALRHILDHAGIEADETMTFGDNSNDLAMIKMAGIGVAMSNSPAYIRDAADFVTTSNDEDGVALAIERFVLSPARN
jgi:Cof subfamily protein (haloacid dehalogenase superfamily)